MTVFKDGAGNNIPTTWTNSFQILSRLEVNLQKQGLIEVHNIIITSLFPDPCSRLMTIAFCERAGKNSHLI